jgi:hypothetical protein
MAFELENSEIIQHVSLINFYDGSLEKLDPFISSIDHLLSHSPAESHAYIIGTVLNTKIDSRVRSSLPLQIGSWEHLKNRILEECIDSKNFSKFYTDLIRSRVADYDNLNLFIEDMRKKFLRYKMALQYANIAQEINNTELVRNLVEQVHKYVEEYVITIAAQSSSYMEALQLIQAKYKPRSQISCSKSDNNDIKDLITQVLTYIKREDSSRNQNSSNQNFRQERNFNQNRNYNNNYRNYNDQANNNRYNNGHFQNNRNYNGQFDNYRENYNQGYRESNNHYSAYSGQNANENSGPRVNVAQMVPLVPQSQPCSYSHQNSSLQQTQQPLNHFHNREPVGANQPSPQNNDQNFTVNQPNWQFVPAPQQNINGNPNPHFGTGHSTGLPNAQ